MNNLLFRTSLAPYRIDTYNALNAKLNCQFFFYWKEDDSQKMDMNQLEKSCIFTPHFLNGIKLGRSSRKICIGIWSIIRKNNPKVIIVPEFQIIVIQILIYKYLFRKKFKIISMCDDSIDMIKNKNDFTLIHKLARKCITPLLDDILLISPQVVNWYQTHYKKGIWLPIIRNEESEAQLYAKALPISNDINKKFNLINKKILLYVGRFVKIKNISRLLEAIGKTKEEFITVIIGDGEEKESLVKQANSIQNKTILFPGHFEGQELRAWYNIGDVFILPSYTEPFGAVVNEALLAGNLTIVSNKAGSECLIQDGVNGYHIDPFNVNDISSKIDMAMQQIPSKSSIIHKKENKMNIHFETIIKQVIKKISE